MSVVLNVYQDVIMLKKNLSKYKVVLFAAR